MTKVGTVPPKVGMYIHYSVNWIPMSYAMLFTHNRYVQPRTQTGWVLCRLRGSEAQDDSVKRRHSLSLTHSFVTLWFLPLVASLVAIYKSLSSYKIGVRVSRHKIGTDVADDEEWLNKYFKAFSLSSYYKQKGNSYQSIRPW